MMSISMKELVQLEWQLLKKLSTTKFVTAPTSSSCSAAILSTICEKSTGVSTEKLIKLGAVYIKAAGDLKPKRILSDVQVSEGDLIRIHPYPRRYRTIHNIQWKQAIVYECDEYVIINKPSGIPSHPTVDNFHENILEGARLATNSEELFLPHRLDTDTSGLILLGKSRRFSSYFSTLLKSRQNITKRYRAIIGATSLNRIQDVLYKMNLSRQKDNDEVNIKIDNENYHEKGLLITNYLQKSLRTPKIFSDTPSEESAICQLLLSSRSRPTSLTACEWKEWCRNIPTEKYDPSFIENFRKGFFSWLDKEQLRPSISSNIKEYSDLTSFPTECSTDSTEDDKKRFLTFWEVEIELLTGRTHQCRGQLQALGDDIHIAGDNMYFGATTPSIPDGYQSSAFLALQAYHLSFRVNPPADQNGPIPPSDRIPKTVSYELKNSWWQPLSDFLKERETNQ